MRCHHWLPSLPPPVSTAAAPMLSFAPHCSPSQSRHLMCVLAGHSHPPQCSRWHPCLHYPPRSACAVRLQLPHLLDGQSRSLCAMLTREPHTKQIPRRVNRPLRLSAHRLRKACIQLRYKLKGSVSSPCHSRLKRQSIDEVTTLGAVAASSEVSPTQMAECRRA